MLRKVVARHGRVKVRRFRRRDLKSRLEWPPYTQPLSAHLNHRLSTFMERERWLLARMTNTGRMYFAVEDENARLIGEMSLREINTSARTSRLGIHLASNKVGRGYGREALLALLDHYFDRMRFNAMFLDVAAHNKRAIRLYEGLNFQHIRAFWRLAESQAPVFTDDRYADIKRFFRRAEPLVECLHYDMALTRDHYFDSRRRSGDSRRKLLPDDSERTNDAETLLLQE